MPATAKSIANDKDAYVSLRDLIAPLFRRKRLWLTSFIVIFALLALIILVKADTYEASTSFLVNRDRMDPTVTTQATNSMVGVSPPLTEEEINSEAELLLSRDLLDRVVLANGMQKEKPSIFNILHPHQTDADREERAVRALAKKLKILTPTKTNLIEVTYVSTDPQLAYGVLNSLANFYLEKHASVHRAPGSFSFFSREAQRYRDALEASEGRLRQFGEQQQVAAPETVRTDLALQLATSIGGMHSIEQSIAAAQQRIASDEQQLRNTPQRSSTKESSNAADVLLQQLSVTLLSAETKLNQLREKYDASYPLVQNAEQEVAADKTALEQAQQTRFVNRETDRDPTFEMLREDLAKSKADLAANRAALVASRQGIESMQAEMVHLGDESLHLADLQREAKANEDNYLLYVSKREQERTSDALDRTRIEDVSIAVPPAAPVLPIHSKIYYLTLSIFIAFFLSTAIAYIADYLSPSFHSPGQIVDMLGIPIVVALKKRSA